METIEKEQESVTNPPECRPQTLKQPENARFALLTDKDLTTIKSSAEAKETKKTTKWIVATIKGKYIFSKKVVTSFQLSVETSLLFTLYSQSGAVLECKLKLNRREGKCERKTQACHPEGRHREVKKQCIPKFQRSCRSSPPSLVYCNLVLVRCESQRQLKTDSFRFMRDAEGHEYAEMVHSVQTKNH